LAKLNQGVQNSVSEEENGKTGRHAVERVQIPLPIHLNITKDFFKKIIIKLLYIHNLLLYMLDRIFLMIDYF
jgi:hypothetical protein